MQDKTRWYLLLSQTQIEREPQLFLGEDCCIVVHNVGLNKPEHKAKPIESIIEDIREDWHEALNESEEIKPDYLARFWFWEVGEDEEIWDATLVAAEQDILPFLHNFTYVEELPNGSYITHRNTDILIHSLLKHKER